jgi:GlcNAc-PI de-N-acetylase
MQGVRQVSENFYVYYPPPLLVTPGHLPANDALNRRWLGPGASCFAFRTLSSRRARGLNVPSAMNLSRLSSVLNRLRPGIGVGRLLGRLIGWRPLFELPACLEKPEGARVMVIAPHPDDETIGCGGTLRKHHLAGDRVTAVFMTDGSKGAALAGGISGEAIIELRKHEARAAAAVLGIDECIFLRNQDTYLQCSPHTVGQLRRLLQSLQPDIVYAPSPLETHRDHREACVIAACALGEYSQPVQVYLYEI